MARDTAARATGELSRSATGMTAEAAEATVAGDTGSDTTP